jgi:hypothetical protein
VTRAGGLAGALVVGALVATACSSGAKAPAAPAAAAAQTRSTAGSGSSSGCVGASASGASGSGDVAVPGDIPDNQAYVAYRSAAGGFHLSVPEGWARSESSTTTFSDKFSSISVQIASAPVPPSVASAQASDVAALATSVPCFEAGKVSQVARTSGAAVMITYRADSPPDPVTGKVVLQDVERYEFWQSGKQATVTLSSPKGSDNVDPWRKVTDSFGWGA